MSLQHVQQGAAPSTSALQTLRKILERSIIGFCEFLLKQWVNILAVVLGALVLTALAIPFLSYLGLDFIAKPLFFSLHLICAQIPSHSFFILGHQLGFCARNLSIYGSMSVGCLIFSLSKKRLPGLPWWLWILLLLPMAIDGTTQLFGWRESNWELRIITGTLFGLANVWFVLPLIERLLHETPTPPAPQQIQTTAADATGTSFSA